MNFSVNDFVSPEIRIRGWKRYVIRPDVTDFHWADFAAGEKCRQRGLEAGRAALPELVEMIRWRKSLAYRMKQVARRMLQMPRD